MFENMNTDVGYSTVSGEQGRFCYNLKEKIYVNSGVGFGIFFSKVGLLLTSVKTILSGSCSALIDCTQTP